LGGGNYAVKIVAIHKQVYIPSYKRSASLHSEDVDVDTLTTNPGAQARSRDERASSDTLPTRRPPPALLRPIHGSGCFRVPLPGW
jgi:hypothetical protein